MAKTPPVMAPDIIAFQGSSFWRTLFKPQSKVVNKPPQTAKFPNFLSIIGTFSQLPPSTGARALTANKALGILSPYFPPLSHLEILFSRFSMLLTLGAFLAPFTACQIPPPMAPMENAPPKSFKITQGQGSREWSELRITDDCWVFLGEKNCWLYPSKKYHPLSIP